MADTNLKFKLEDGTTFEINKFNGLQSVESTSETNTTPKEINYGVIPNSGSAEIVDADGQILQRIQNGSLSNSNVEVDLYLNGAKQQTHITTDSDYNVQDKIYTIEMTDKLSQWDNLVFNGMTLTNSDSAYIVLKKLLGTNGLGYSYNDIETMLSTPIVYGKAYIVNTVKTYLESITIPYPYLEKSSYREAIEKICTLAQLNVFMDNNGLPKFVSARPLTTDSEIDNAIFVPKSLQLSNPTSDVILKNKYDGIDTDIKNIKKEYKTLYSSDKITFTNSGYITQSVSSTNTDYTLSISQYLGLTLPTPYDGCTEGKELTVSYSFDLSQSQEIFKWNTSSFKIYYTFTKTEQAYIYKSGWFSSSTTHSDTQSDTSGYISSPTLSISNNKLNITFKLLVNAYFDGVLSSESRWTQLVPDYLNFYIEAECLTVTSTNMTSISPATIFANELLQDGTIYTYRINPEYYIDEGGSGGTYISSASLSGFSSYTYDTSTGYITGSGEIVVTPSSIPTSMYQVTNQKDNFAYGLYEYTGYITTVDNITYSSTTGLYTYRVASDYCYLENYDTITVPLSKQIKNNVGIDYENGISTSSIELFCGDMYDDKTKTTKLKDFSQGQVINSSDIVYFENDTNLFGDQRYWKVVSRNLAKEGYPKLNLTLMEILPYPNEWSKKIWGNKRNVYATNIWDDGSSVYYSDGNQQYVLKNNTWVAKTWNISTIYGNNIWKYNNHIYYSNGSNQYELVDGAWTTKTWSGLTNFDGKWIWEFNDIVYYSNDTFQYVLDATTSTWSAKTWTGLTSFDADGIWVYNNQVYFSYSTDNHYVLDTTTSTWSAKSWSGFSNFYGSDIWQVDGRVFCSNGNYQYELIDNNWVEKEWSGATNFTGAMIWQWDDKVYISANTIQYRLNYINACETPEVIEYNNIILQHNGNRESSGNVAKYKLNDGSQMNLYDLTPETGGLRQITLNNVTKLEIYYYGYDVHYVEIKDANGNIVEDDIQDDTWVDVTQYLQNGYTVYILTTS